MSSRNLVICHAGIPAGFILERVRPQYQAGVFKTAPELFPASSITNQRHIELTQNAFKETEAEGITLVHDLSMSGEFRELMRFAAGTLGCTLNEVEYDQPLAEHNVVTISGVGNSCWNRIETLRNIKSRKKSWHLTLPKLSETPVSGSLVTYMQMVIRGIFEERVSRLIFMGNGKCDFSEGKQHASGVLLEVMKIIKLDPQRTALSYGHPSLASENFAQLCFDRLVLETAA